MQKKYIILLFILLISLPTLAQFDRELAGVDYVRLGDENSSNSVKFQKFSFRLTIPKRLNEKGSVLINKIEYAKTSIDYSTGPSIIKDLERFHTISYSLGYRRTLKRDWSMVAMITPGMSSNFVSSVNWNDIRLFGLVMFTKPLKSNLRLSIGAMYSSTTGIPVPLPVFSLRWKPAPKLSVNIGFPKLGVKYHLTPKTEIGANLIVAGENFTLTDNLFFEGKKMDNIRLMNIGGGLLLNQKLSKYMKLKLTAGYTFYRKFEFLGGQDSVLEYNLDNDLYIKVGLSVGF